jgi:hypothetical protein
MKTNIGIGSKSNAFIYQVERRYTKATRSDAAKENLTYFEWYRRDPDSIEESRIDEGLESDD